MKVKQSNEINIMQQPKRTTQSAEVIRKQWDPQLFSSKFVLIATQSSESRFMHEPNYDERKNC